MGIFSKIKNYFTGGAAEVTVVFESSSTNGQEPVRLFVMALANDNCKVKEVYLKVRGEETYMKRVQRNTTDSEGRTSTSYVDEQRQAVHFTESISVASDITLEQGQESKWLVAFDLPADATPTFHGRHCSMKWQVQAGLDMPGNDPDSGWVELFVTKNMNYTLEQSHGSF